MRVLLVEDSARLQRSLGMGLRKDGYAVDVTGDGIEGLKLAATWDYDVIILDLMLPGLDGMTLLQRLRETGRQSPVLILTARDSLEDRVGGLRQGADDYLTKPFAYEELLARIESLVRRKYGDRHTVIRVGDLEIHPLSRKVHRAGQEIALPPREYRLLEFLARRRGEVVSRSEIEEHLYDREADLFSNVVDSTVAALRRKLHLHPECAPLIHTRRGMGYVLEAEA